MGEIVDLGGHEVRVGLELADGLGQAHGAQRSVGERLEGIEVPGCSREARDGDDGRGVGEERRGRGGLRAARAEAVRSHGLRGRGRGGRPPLLRPARVHARLRRLGAPAPAPWRVAVQPALAVRRRGSRRRRVPDRPSPRRRAHDRGFGPAVRGRAAQDHRLVRGPRAPPAPLAVGAVSRGRRTPAAPRCGRRRSRAPLAARPRCARPPPGPGWAPGAPHLRSGAGTGAARPRGARWGST